MSRKRINILKDYISDEVSKRSTWTAKEVNDIVLAGIRELETKAGRKLSDKLYTRMMLTYDQFCIKKIGVKAKIGAAEGKAMKTIISYLQTNVKNKTNIDDDVLGAWEYILSNVDKWDPFHQSQLKIVQIDSNLPNILNSIRNGKQKNASIAKSTAEQTNDVLDLIRQRRSGSGPDGTDNHAGKHLPAK